MVSTVGIHLVIPFLLALNTDKGLGGFINNFLTLNANCMKPRQTEKAQSGVAEVELVYRSKVKAADRPKILSAAEAYKILLNHWNKETIELLEEFKVMLLGYNGSLLGICEVSKGGISATFVDPRLIYAAALKAASAVQAIIL